MNYALDLTQVANEGARLAAVASADEATLRARLKSWELRDGNPSSGGNKATFSICVKDMNADGSLGQGDAVTVEITSGYKWFPFPGWIKSFGINSPGLLPIKGKATMRVEQATTTFAACP
jgi:hypothetical protein